MLKTKLVEKEVEVTVTELQQVTEYEYDGESFEKYPLQKHIERLIYQAGDDALKTIGTHKGCLTAVRKIIGKMGHWQYIQIYEAVKKYVEVLEELDQD